MFRSDVFVQIVECPLDKPYLDTYRILQRSRL